MTIEGVTSLDFEHDPTSFVEAERFIFALLRENKYSVNNPTYNNPIITMAEAVRIGRNLDSGIHSIIAPPVEFVLASPFSLTSFSIGSLKATIGFTEDIILNMYKGWHFEVDKNTMGFPTSVAGPQTRNWRFETLGQYAQKVNMFGRDERMEDKVLIDPTNPFIPGPNQKFEKTGAGVDIVVPDYEKIFSKGVGFTFEGGARGAGFNLPLPQRHFPVPPAEKRLQKAYENEDTFFTDGDARFGYVDTDVEDYLVDDDYYIPFSFQDLRKPERKIFFKAYINGFTEDKNIEWSMERYYGRVDPVVTYTGWERTVNVSFHIAAMSAKGLSSMWKKINNFSKMLLPTYRAGIITSAPLVRLRIGDVICDATGLGLPGVIRSAQFDYNESPWELSSYSGPAEFEVGKVPMICKLNISFLVLHENQPGVNGDYTFTRPLRRMGSTDPAKEEFIIDEEE